MHYEFSVHSHSIGRRRRSTLFLYSTIFYYPPCLLLFLGLKKKKRERVRKLIWKVNHLDLHHVPFRTNSFTAQVLISPSIGSDWTHAVLRLIASYMYGIYCLSPLFIQLIPSLDYHNLHNTLSKVISNHKHTPPPLKCHSKLEKNLKRFVLKRQLFSIGNARTYTTANHIPSHFMQNMIHELIFIIYTCTRFAINNFY